MDEDAGPQGDGLWSRHFHWRVLLAWGVLSWILGSLLAVAGLLFAADQFLGVNICFTATAVFILAKVAQLAITSVDAPSHRMVFTFVMFGLVGLAIVETVRGVNSWRRSHEPPPDAVLSAPSLKVDAYIQPGSSNPYPLQATVGGITWNDNYVDVRLDVGVGPDAVQNLDFEVALDTNIAGIGQISQFTGVTSFPSDTGKPSMSFSLIGTDEKGKPVTIPVVPTKGLAQIVGVYRVHCDALYGNTVLHLVIAAASLNPPDQGRLPKQLFAARKIPHSIQLRGTYEVASKKFPLDFRKTFEDETPTALPGAPTPSPASHKPSSKAPKQQPKPAITINNAPQGIANSGTIIGNPTVNNFGPPPVELHWIAESIASAKPDFANETRITVSVNTPYTPVSLAFVCDADVEGIEFNFGSAAAALLNVSTGTDSNNRKIAFLKFGGTPITPETPLYVLIWSNEPLHVLQVGPARFR